MNPFLPRQNNCRGKKGFKSSYSSIDNGSGVQTALIKQSQVEVKSPPQTLHATVCVYIASKYTKDRFDLNPGSDLVKKKPEVF